MARELPPTAPRMEAIRATAKTVLGIDPRGSYWSVLGRDTGLWEVWSDIVCHCKMFKDRKCIVQWFFVLSFERTIGH